MPKPELILQRWSGLDCDVCAAAGVKRQCSYCRAHCDDVAIQGRLPASIMYDQATHGQPDCVCEEHATAPFPVVRRGKFKVKLRRP
jgi:hypothetical protein